MTKATPKKAPANAILMISASIVVIVCLWSLTLSPYFRISEVVVKGQFYCPQSFLDDNLDPDRLGNIFTVSTRSVRHRLLQSPWIVSVDISRELPNRLEVIISETYPVAAIAIDNGFTLISPDAIAIQNIQQLSEYSVPLLTTSVPVPLQEGKQIEIPFIIDAVRAIATLAYSGLPVQLSQVDLLPGERVALYFRGGLKVSLGELTNLEDKLKLLLVIVNEEGGDLDHIDTISLDDDNGPVVKYKLN